MDSSPHQEAPKEPEAPQALPREESDAKLLGDSDTEMEAARVEALLAQQRLLKLQEKRSRKKTSWPAPAPMPTQAEKSRDGAPDQEQPTPPMETSSSRMRRNSQASSTRKKKTNNKVRTNKEVFSDGRRDVSQLTPPLCKRNVSHPPIEFSHQSSV